MPRVQCPLHGDVELTGHDASGHRHCPQCDSLQPELRTCVTCGGTGAHCYRCNGIGMLYESTGGGGCVSEVCPSCKNGSPSVCPNCNGSGKAYYPVHGYVFDVK